jgi:ectoine hydrolase
MDYLSARLTERGLSKGRIGVEMDNYWFSAAAFAALQKGCPTRASPTPPGWSTGGGP